MPNKVKFDALNTVNQLVNHAGKKAKDAKHDKVAEAIASKLIPAYFPNQHDLIKRLIEMGGDDLSYLVPTPKPLTKPTKDAAYYGIPKAFELVFTEKDLQGLLDTQAVLTRDTESYISTLVKETADAASKEPLAKNAPIPYPDAVTILEQTYPQSYNRASDLIQRMQELLQNTAVAQTRTQTMLAAARAAIETRKENIKKESAKLAEEKNNLDHYNAWTKASAALYPTVEKPKAPVKAEGWTLDQYSLLLEEGNHQIGTVDAYLLHDASQLLSKLVGRRHAMKTPVAEMPHFQSKTEKYTTRYNNTQAALQQKMDNLEGLKLTIDELEPQIQEKLASATAQVQAQLNHLVLKFKDFTDDANALVPYALMENDQKRNVRVLNAAANEKYPEVAQV